MPPRARGRDPASCSAGTQAGRGRLRRGAARFQRGTSEPVTQVILRLTGPSQKFNVNPSAVAVLINRSTHPQVATNVRASAVRDCYKARQAFPSVVHHDEYANAAAGRLCSENSVSCSQSDGRSLSFA